MGKRSYQLTGTSQFTNHGQIGWHWLADKSYLPCGKIFISSFSELLGINIESLNSILLRIQLFIQIYFNGVWCRLKSYLHWSHLYLHLHMDNVQWNPPMSVFCEIHFLGFHLVVPRMLLSPFVLVYLVYHLRRNINILKYISHKKGQK